MISDVPQLNQDGKWRVGDRLFETNAQAWRYIDKANNDPVSRAQDVSDWIFFTEANDC